MYFRLSTALVLTLLPAMRLLLLLFLLLYAPGVFAQVEWVRTIASTGADNLEKHVLDPEGNVVAVGFYGGDIQLGTTELTHYEGTDIVLFKANPQGDILWAKSLYGPSWGGDCSVATDAAGNIYVVGGFVKELFYEGRKVLAGGDRWNSFISKFDKDGQLLWIRGILGQAGEPSEARVMGNLSVNAAGDIAIAGNYGGRINLSGTIISNDTGSSSSNFFIARYSPGGDLIWVKTPYSQTNVEPRGIKIDREQKVYLCGAYTNSVHFDAVVLTAATTQYSDIFLASFGADGRVAWAKAINKVSANHRLNHTATQLGLDESTGALYMAASFRSDVDAEGRLIESFVRSWGDDTDTPSDILLVKYLTNGTLVWTNRLGSEQGHDYPCDLFILPGGQGIVAGAGGGDIGAPFYRYFTADGSLGDERVFESGGPITSVSPAGGGVYYLSQRFWHLLLLNPFRVPEVTTGAASGEGDGALFKIASCGSESSQPPVPQLSLKCREIQLTTDIQSLQIQWYRNGQVLEGQHGQRLVLGEGGVYTASLSNACGIRYSEELVAGLPDGSGISLYNVITPNGDGDNDALVLPHSLAGSAIRIYNRWGKEIYKSFYYENDWKGTDLPTGTYYYIVINPCYGRYTSPLTIIR
jgi:gliding motility-associated-like protein